MNIETKFQLGQKVWVIESRPLKSETCQTCSRFDMNLDLAARQVDVHYVAAKVGLNGVEQIHYWVSDQGELIDNSFPRSEESIFASQQECFDAIAKQKEKLYV